MRQTPLLAVIILSALSFIAFAADPECPLPLPPNICAIINTYIADVDGACSEFPDNDKLRSRALEDIKQKFFQDIKSTLVYPCDKHLHDLFPTAAGYSKWSDKILWGMQIEYWRSQTNTIEFWQTERKKTLEDLKSFCR